MSFIPIKDYIPIVHTSNINMVGISDEERKTVFYIENGFFQDVNLISPDMVEYSFSRFHL
jgi:hypothetical protein